MARLSQQLEKFWPVRYAQAMDRLSLLDFLNQGPKTRKEIMDNGIRYNTTFRVIVDELEREGLVSYAPESDTVTITPLGRRGLQAAHS